MGAVRRGRAENRDAGLDRFTTADAMAASKVARGCAVDRSILAALVRGRLAADVVVFGSVRGAGRRKTIRACVLE